jgi:hypothetical protein
MIRILDHLCRGRDHEYLLALRLTIFKQDIAAARSSKSLQLSLSKEQSQMAKF